jgi:hypothetical protein
MEKRIEVERRLTEIGRREGLIPCAEAMLSEVKERLSILPPDALLSGICYRSQLVAGVVKSCDNPMEYRRLAAAAIIYLAEVCDVTDDNLGLIGLLDDDYALRAVLAEIGLSERETLHWSERVAGLWEDLPFLQGMNLRVNGQSIASGWLDRINSYLCYSHVLNQHRDVLLLLEPTIACSLLGPVMALVSLLVFDGLTSSQNSARSLTRGRVYAIDEKFFVKFAGIDASTGGLLLECKRGINVRSTFLATRMTPAGDHALSSMRAISLYLKEQSQDPLQRFFGWPDPIGTAAIPGRIVVVSSRSRALKIFDSVESNDVSLMRDGLVRFAGSDVQDALGGLVLVVPSVAAVRKLSGTGISARVVIVDGYERLDEGKHDLAFLQMGDSRPSIIVWSPKGYYPLYPLNWLPANRCIEVSSGDLSEILELDQYVDEHTAVSITSLWEVLTGPEVRFHGASNSDDEARLIGLIGSHLDIAEECDLLPQYWRHHIVDGARRMKRLIEATATDWSEIRLAVERWLEANADKWSRLRSHRVSEFSSLREIEARIKEELSKIPNGPNSKGKALVSYLFNNEAYCWSLVCGSKAEAMSARRLVEEQCLARVEVVTLRDLDVCKYCLIAGWLGSIFGRKLMAHSPREIVVLAVDSERERWREFSRHVPARRVSALQMINAEGGRNAMYLAEQGTVQAVSVQRKAPEKEDSPCVVLWLADEPSCKIVARESLVLVAQDGRASMREAQRVRPFDQVVLGFGSSQWSPAEEFTNEVLASVEKTRPELVDHAKEWRRILMDLQIQEDLSGEEVRRKLSEVGVHRELATIEGWLNMERPGPIGPRHLEADVAAIWRVAGKYSRRPFEDVVKACGSLRSLHWAASQAIIKASAGLSLDNVGSDEDLLKVLVSRLRARVELYEVERVENALVPTEMLGWWIPSDLADQLAIVDCDPCDYAASSEASYEI